MTAEVRYEHNLADAPEIEAHLRACDAQFDPPLTGRVDIAGYARKIATHAARCEAWAQGRLVGLVALYCNDPSTRRAHITSVSVLPAWARQGIARRLVSDGLAQARRSGMRCVGLQVGGGNEAAIALYRRLGFTAHAAPAVGGADVGLIDMAMDLDSDLTSGAHQ